MKKTLSELKVSVICHTLFTAGVLPLLFMFDKHESLLFINGQHSVWSDRFFYHVTRLPEIAMIVFVVILSLFYERRVFLAVAVTMSLCGISILLFKNIIFPDMERPFQWLNATSTGFHRVDGIRLHSNGSFPSGHTMAAFTSLALSGFISRSGILQFLLFVLACLSAYSRVYTAQHYLMDVYAGAVYGFILSLFFYLLFTGMFRTSYWKNPVIRTRR